MAKLSFAIALNLITDGFKRGTNQVKSGMASIKASAMSVAAYFGVGFIGIKMVFDKIRDAGLQTAKAINVLKANSGGLAQFGTNLSYIRGLASKYKLELTSLITEYSKFTAAATTAGFSVKQQQTIFEGVQKAIKGYKLDEEASATVMASLQKMMNTGTISTRNFTNSFLRSMPQAKKALADAMGVGVDKINALVKKGIDAKGVMESFATNLQRMSPSVKTDDLGSAKNRISNALSGIAEDTSVVKWLANITNKVADLIEYVRANATSLAYTIAGLMAGIKMSQFFAQWKIFSRASSDAMVTNATVAHAKVRMLESSTARLKRQITASEVQMDKLSADERLAAEVQLNAKKKQLAANELALTKAKNTAKVADERAAAVQSGNAWTATWAKIKTGATALGVSLKAAFSTIGPMLLITALTEIIAKIIQVTTATSGLRKDFEGYKKELYSTTHSGEIAELTRLRKMLNDNNLTVSEHKKILGQIQNQLGTRIDDEGKLNRLLTARIDILRANAIAEYAAQKQMETEQKMIELGAKHGGQGNLIKEGQRINREGSSMSDLWNGTGPDYQQYSELSAQRKYWRNLSNKNYKKVLSGSGTDYSPALSGGGGVTSGGRGGTGSNTAADELAQAQSSYAQQLRELAARKGIEKMSDADYNKSVLDATTQTLVQVQSSQYSSVAQSDFAKTLKAKADKLTRAKELDDISRFTADYNKQIKDLTNQFNAGAITEDEYTQGMQSITDSAKKQIASFAAVNNASQEYTAALFDAVSAVSTQVSGFKQTLPKEQSRDTTFDYKKSEADILGERLDAAQKRLDELKSMALQASDQMVNEINAQLGKVMSLSDALKLAEVKKDVKTFAKELRTQAWGSIKSIMSGSDQIVSSWEQLGKTLNDADASGWEKIMAVWSALENSVDGILGIIDAVNSWTKASKDLQAAKQAEATITTATTAQEITATTAGTTASATAAGVEAANNQRTVAGNMAAAGSEVVKQNSKIPIVGIALAAAGLIAIMALMSQLPKFAKGGIVSGGGTSGDNMLARVNSGEMILNGSQQKRLFNAINGGLGASGEISLTSSKVRGEDMYLAIKNYMKSKNKSW